jgi:YVTN family beta-propeller protein
MKIKHDNILPITMLLVSLQACAGDDASKPFTGTEGDAAAVRGANAGSDAGTGNAAAAGFTAGAGNTGAAGDAAPVVSGRKAYIGLFGDGAIGVLDVDNKRIVKTVPVSAPDGLIITPDGAKVFVASTDTGTVKVLDTKTDTISDSIDVGSKPAGIAITRDGKLVVAAVGGANEAVIIDAATDAIVRHVTVSQAHSSCITSDGHYAYVGSQDTNAPAVVKVDLEQDTPPQIMPVDKSPRALACEADRIYFSAVGLDAVEVLDPATGVLGTPIASGGSPHDVRAAVPGHTELVVSQNAGDLEFIDVASATVVTNVPTGKLAHWITLTTDRTTAYVTNEGDNNVSVVDLAQRVVTDTIDVGKAPRKMAIQP